MEDNGPKSQSSADSNYLSSGLKVSSQTSWKINKITFWSNTLLHGPLHLLSAFFSSFLQQKTGKQKKNDQRKTYIGLQSQKNDWHGEPFKKEKKKFRNGENYNSRGFVLKEMMKIRKALCQKKGMRKFILESGSTPSSTIQYMGEYIKQSSLSFNGSFKVSRQTT